MPCSLAATASRACPAARSIAGQAPRLACLPACLPAITAINSPCFLFVLNVIQSPTKIVFSFMGSKTRSKARQVEARHVTHRDVQCRPLIGQFGSALCSAHGCSAALGSPWDCRATMVCCASLSLKTQNVTKCHQSIRDYFIKSQVRSSFFSNLVRYELGGLLLPIFNAPANLHYSTPTICEN